MVVRDGKVITRPEKRARSDKSIHGLKQLARTDPQAAAAQADAIIKNTYRTLMTRGMKGCYVYCTDSETADHFRSRLKSLQPAVVEVVRPVAAHTSNEAANVLPFRVLPKREVRPYKNAVPVFPLKIAAGAFSGPQVGDLHDADWAVPDGVPIGPEMFIAQVVGESMNKKIPNGSWCLFRAKPSGTRQGKVVLAQHRDIFDPDTGGSFTIKVYSSEKRTDVVDGWRHERIVLSPRSSDPSFQPIVIDSKRSGEVEVLAELVAVLV
jgi:uncharacterized protein